MTNYEEPTKISYSQVAKKPAEPSSPESRGDTSPLSFNNIQKALKQPSAATKLSLDDVKVKQNPPPYMRLCLWAVLYTIKVDNHILLETY